MSAAVPANKTVVIKFGTGILTRETSPLPDVAQFAALTQAVADCQAAGWRMIVVSSGAVGAGLSAFGLDQRPGETEMLQACAAVGQCRLMHFYEALFREHGLRVAQLLVTNADFETSSRRTNFQRTLGKLLEFPAVVPIINENDSVATEELRVGDNDKLSANVARLIGAGMLILLTAVDGLADAEGRLVAEVRDMAEAFGHVRADEVGNFSVGGMATKLASVKSVVEAGIPAIIANGRHPRQIPDLLEGRGVGTRFIPASPILTGAPASAG